MKQKFLLKISGKLFSRKNKKIITLKINLSSDSGFIRNSIRNSSLDGKIQPLRMRGYSVYYTKKVNKRRKYLIGTKAPAFELPDQNGEMHTLEEYKGKKVILYFYPRDNTPGCTKQACGFGELYPQFTEKGAVVLGVSKDSVASHKKFETKYELPFTLLSDTELSCIQAYDVWKEKNMYGKKTMGVVRTTYLIDEEGVIVKAFGKVKAADNPAQMLGEL